MIKNLINPILEGKACYVYGRQIGRDTTMFSEERVFSKFFPEDGKYNSPSYFCNNANSAIKNYLLKYKFNEEVTGLEDLELGKRLTEDSGKIEYSNESCVYHIHNESWIKIKNRYERETLAFLNFEPLMKLSFFEVIKGFLLSLLDDFLSSEGFQLKILHKIMSILYYRSAQYVGYWLGNKRGKNITAKQKIGFIIHETSQHRCLDANEG